MKYQSNLVAPDLRPIFKLLVKPHQQTFWHDRLSDPDYEPDCSYWTDDEAAILYHVAKRLGGQWVDLGCRFGWTTAHIAVAGCKVIAVDPVLQFQAQNARFEYNLCHFWSGVLEISHLSAQAWADTETGLYNGFVIDADHDPPQPLFDAQACLRLAQDTCVIMLHDFMGRPVREAVEWLMADGGLKCRIYNTPNMVACCWRGDFTPPDHVADPAIDWAWIRHTRMGDFDFSKCV